MRTADKYTCFRLFFSPIFYLMYMIPVWTGHLSFVSACIMLPLLGFAEFTDFLDGYYARKENAVSDFGKLFDPFADVFLHLTTFYCYVVTNYMPTFLFLLIFYREIGMLFIRLMAAKKGVAIAARKGGKFKTVLYVATSIFCLSVESILRLGFDISSAMIVLKWLGYGLFGLSVVASYISFGDYIVHFKAILTDKK